MYSNQSIIGLPSSLQRKLERSVRTLLHSQNGPRIDFTRPLGERALLPPDSVSWRIFKNPIALMVGGLAAVILELAEPAVRTGVWQHSSFRQDPVSRIKRTGLAAMVTVYGPRSVAEPMIARIVQMHAKVAGRTPRGTPYSASDPRLLSWVQATASYGFAEAYSRYVRPLDPEELDAIYRESAPASKLYGAIEAPTSNAQLHALFGRMQGRLEASPIVFEFLQIMRTTPGFPWPVCWMQGILVRAAVELIPDRIRECLGLSRQYGFRSPAERWIMQWAGSLADRVVFSESPAAQSCVRLGLPAAQLYAS